MAEESGSVESLLKKAEAITSAASGGAKSKTGAELSEEVLAKTQSKSEEAPRGDVSALTLGRMLGLSTAADLKVMESKLDLVASRVNNLSIRMDKVLSGLSSMPSGGDFERIDVQLGQIRALLASKLGVSPKEDDGE